jgi:hypothetical protein
VEIRTRSCDRLEAHWIHCVDENTPAPEMSREHEAVVRTFERWRTEATQGGALAVFEGLCADALASLGDACGPTTPDAVAPLVFQPMGIETCDDLLRDWAACVDTLPEAARAPEAATIYENGVACCLASEVVAHARS